MTTDAPINFRTFDLNLLRVFDEVMAERSLTRAARSLSLTQPAVSNSLRRLRETLGDDLFVRSGQGVAPTQRAIALWPSVRESLLRLEQTLAPSAFDPATAQLVFTLSMADATAAMLIPALARLVERDAPGVSLRVISLSTRDPRPLLESRETDVAIGHFPSVIADLTARAQTGEAVAFAFHRLYASDYVCVMRRGHELANGPLTVERYAAARHLLVSFSGRAYGFIDEALAGMGHERRIVLTVNQFFTAGQVVAHSDLVTVLPRHFVMVTGIADQLVWRELPFASPAVCIDSVWHRRAHLLASHQWLREQIERLTRDAHVEPGVYEDAAPAPAAP